MNFILFNYFLFNKLFFILKIKMQKVEIEENQTKNSELNFKYINFKPYLLFWLISDSILMIGSVFKYIFPIDAKEFGKDNNITGIIFLRNNYFLFPLIITIITLLLIIIIYYTNEKIRENNQSSFINFLLNINLGYLITNFLIFGYFFLFYAIILFIKEKTGFKVSGHTFATLLSGDMLINVIYVFIYFYKNNVSKIIFIFLIFFSMFLLIHSIYVLFWTAWIYHPLSELISSFYFSVLSLIMFHYLSFEKFICKCIYKCSNENIKVDNFNIIIEEKI